MTTESAVPEIAPRFFTVGGTLPPDAPSYVMRQADEDLFAHLSAGDFCYLLTSRQMGKSSLMVRTTARLKAAGARVAILDLTKIGQNVTIDQWYNGLLARLGMSFGMEDKLKEFASRGDAASRSLGPLDRWERAIREVVVPSIPGKIVIFVDEIDFVRSLPFPADEFFAAIRSFYNQRTTNPELNRITFCLIGVATPSDLIRDGSRTPFNIGERINLTDFQFREAEPFIKGMGRTPEIGAKLVRRVLWWTGGHPYLTQRLCAAVAADPDVDSASGVDRVCSDLFLAAHSRDTDNNLLFVSHRITDRSNANRNSANRRSTDQGPEDEADKSSEIELAAVLDLYGRVRSGKMVLFDKENRNIEFLLLAGIVTVRDRVPPVRNFLRKLSAALHGNPLTGAEKVSEQVLVVRNRVYERVFDKHWIRANMPEAEARRQRAAFYRGLLYAAGIALVVFAAIGALMLKNLEDEQAVAISSYCSNIVQVQQDFDSGDYASGYNLLRETVPLVRLEPRKAEKLLGEIPLLKSMLPIIIRHPKLYAVLNGFDEKAMGGFEWNYLLARSFGDSAWAYSGHINEVRSVAFSSDGQWAVTAGADSTVRVFNVSSIMQATGNAPPYAPSNPLVRALLVLDNKDDYKVSQPDGTASWSVNDQLTKALSGKKPTAGLLPGVMSVQFSPDGAWIAIATGNWNQPQIPGTIYLWSTKAPYRVVWVHSPATRFLRAADAVVFKPAPPGSTGPFDLACTSEDNTAEFWSVASDGTVTLKGQFPSDQPINNLPGGQVAKTLPDGWPAKGMNAAAYSPDGKTFAMIFGDGHLWIRDGAEPWKSGRDVPIFGDISGLMSIAFYHHPLRDPKTQVLKGTQDLVLLGTRDGHVKSYDLSSTDNKLPSTYLETGQGLVTSLTISHDSNLLITTGSTGTILVWPLIRDQHDWTLDESPTRTPSDGIMLRSQRDVAYSAAITTNNSLIVAGGANALTGGSGQRSTSQTDEQQALVSAPGSRVLFWKKQRGYVDGVTLPDETVPSTWVSQPASIPIGGSVQALAFSPDGSQFASIRGASSKNKLRPEIDFVQLDQKTERPASPPTSDVPTSQAAGTALAWSLDGKSLVTAMDDGSVLLWDPAHITQRPQSLKTLLAANGAILPIQTLSFSPGPDGWLAGAAGLAGASQTFTWENQTYSSQSAVFLWKPQQLSDIPTVVALPPPQTPAQPASDHDQRYFLLQKLVFAPSGGWLAACGVDSFDNQVEVEIWTIDRLLGKSPQPLHTLSGSEFPPQHNHTASLHGQCTAVAFSPNGQWLAVGTYSHEIAVWSTSNWMRVESESEFVASGALYGATSRAQGRFIDAPPMTTSAINTVAFSPDNLRLAYGAADGKIYLWSVTAQLPVSTVSVHSGGVLAIAFSPNGNCLASGSYDQNVRFACGIDPDFKASRLAISSSSQNYQRLSPEADNWSPYPQ